MQISVVKPDCNTITLNVESNERVGTIKRKLKKKEGIRSDLHVGLIYNGKLLDDGQTLGHYNIWKGSTFRLFLSEDALAETWDIYVKTCSRKKCFSLEVNGVDTIDDVKAKIQENGGIPQDKQLLFLEGKWLDDGNRTLFDCDIHNRSILHLAIQFQQDGAVSEANVVSEKAPLSKRPAPAPLEDPRQTKRAAQTTPNKATAVAGMMGIQANSSASVLIELEDVKREMVALKAENMETKQELMVAHSKEKEQEATISRLTHKTKVFSELCASFESQVVALEVENKNTKQEFTNADKKYYAEARAAGYTEGLKEGKAKWLKSVEFLHHLTDASMQYFNYGFDSCQKQAEHQGFLGKLNKGTALKEAPELKGWETSEQLSKDANLEIPEVSEEDAVSVQKTGGNVPGR